MENAQFTEDWKSLLKFLPENWEQKARELGAFSRAREIKDPEMLLRLILIHVGEGLSLRHTAFKAELSEFASISDVALLKRLKKSKDWLWWMLNELIGSREIPDNKFSVRIVDSTLVSEPGKTGSSWRMHYSMSLPDLKNDFLKITSLKQGENISVFPINKGDLMLGDRGYGKAKQIAYLKEKGADFIGRWHSSNCPIYETNGKLVNLIPKLKSLKIGESREWDGLVKNEKTNYKVRICALKCNKQAAEREQRKTKRKSKMNGCETKEETLVFCNYIIVISTVGREVLSCEDVLKLYRARWQIELKFKRLKSLLELGHLAKYDKNSSQAWLYAKLILAALIDKIVREADLFSPWGYRI